MSRLYNDEPRLGAAHLITITIMLKMMLATVVMMTMNYDFFGPNFNVLAVVTIASTGECELP